MQKESRIKIIKYAPPPAELPVYGRSAPEETSFFGRTNYVGALEEKKFVFGIKRRDRRRHMHIIGKSGTGKSKLIELLIRQDIANGYGLCFFDFHGDTIAQILDAIPESRVRDVVLIDPMDPHAHIAFNPLKNIDPSIKHRLAHAFLGVMKKQFDTDWTPRIEHLLRFSILALFDYPGATIEGLSLLSTDESYRARVIPTVREEIVKRFWEKEFLGWAEKFETESIIPLVNTMSQFLADPAFRSFFKHTENKIHFETLTHENKIILINLAKGKWGERNARFFGSLALLKLQEALMVRALHAGEPQKDFYVYLDDFSPLMLEMIEDMLMEGRKYGFCFTLSQQYLAQLSSHAQAAILGNTGTLVVFRIGGDDALRLKSEMAPVFDVKDMINLGTQEFYIKMMIDGETQDPFSAETLKVLAPPHPSFREAIIRNNCEMFSVVRAEHQE